MIVVPDAVHRVAPIVQRMTALGMFVSAPLRAKVLAAAGEDDT